MDTKSHTDPNVAALLQKKVDIGGQIRDLQSQLKELNVQLLRAGADPHVALCW